MVFNYLSYNSPNLRQGEIVSNLFELKLQIPDRSTIDAENEKFAPIVHPFVIVVSQDCDLEQDHGARLGTVASDKLLTHVLVCALFTQDELEDRNGIKGSARWKRVRQNQDERYHCLSEAPIEGTKNILPELIADFKTTFSLATDYFYWLVSSGQATREAALSSPYVEDFMHRIYSFLGRVATPEISVEPEPSG